MPAIGTKETVADSSAATWLLHEAFFAPDRMILTIVGDVKTDYAIKGKGGLQGFKRAGKTFARPLLDSPPSGIVRTGEAKDKADPHGDPSPPP